jgi:mRNA interferase YafQ
MYYIRRSGQFKKDYKLCQKRNYNMDLLKKAIITLQTTGNLSVADYGTHPLRNDWAGCFDSHIAPDWILIWYPSEETDWFDENNPTAAYEGTINLVCTGTHSGLF